MNRMLAKKTDVDRKYLLYLEVGRSLMNLEKEYEASMVRLSKYMIETDAPKITALKHQTSKALYSVPKGGKKYLLEAGTQEDLQDTQPMTATQKAKKLKGRYKRNYKWLMRERWSQKPVYGKFPSLLEKEYFDREQSFQWMKYRGLKGEI